jgi:methylamine methyltransferase corrinoid activation protein
MKRISPIKTIEARPRRLAVAMDIGTSGFRTQALDLSTGEVLSSVITTRHPLPGANVIDHLHFALELGIETARDMMIRAVNQIIRQLHVSTSSVVRLAVCGNPAQLSLFQGMEIRDLAFAGIRKLNALGVVAPERNAAIRRAAEFPGLALSAQCEVLIPPAVRHEIGADALALILQSGMLERNETAIAIDYGTNAEMALMHNGRIITGSAAAGPALEGQHITCGTVAMPGAIVDLKPDGDRHQLIVLDEAMQPRPGAWINLRKATNLDVTALPQPIKITGTGTIAALDQGLESGIIELPHIRTNDQKLHLGTTLFINETDLAEAGKAIGAIRAGYCTLALEAGIALEQIQNVYLAGATGTYLDALKARRLGLIPPCAQTIRHVGNSSLAMARELALTPNSLVKMNALARRLQETHCMFASSKTFANLFLLELSHWTEGMPMSMYQRLLERYHLHTLPSISTTEQPDVIRTITQDISDPGRMGLVTLERVGLTVSRTVDGCNGCRTCLKACPTGALSIWTNIQPPTLALSHALCNGVACRRCESACPVNVLHLGTFFAPTSGSEPENLNPKAVRG